MGGIWRRVHWRWRWQPTTWVRLVRCGPTCLCSNPVLTHLWPPCTLLTAPGEAYEFNAAACAQRALKNRALVGGLMSGMGGRAGGRASQPVLKHLALVVWVGGQMGGWAGQCGKGLAEHSAGMPTS